MKALYLTLFLSLLTSCQKDKPGPEYVFMDMQDSQATIPMRPNRLFKFSNSLLTPAEDTVKHTAVDYPFIDNPEAAAQLSNPVPRTVEYMERGKIAFDRFCLPCHGPTGEGNGTILERDGHRTGFPMPPTLHSKKIREQWSDGRIYHVIMVGQNNVMPAYASRIQEVDRWSIIHYIRALSKAEYATQADKEKVDNGNF